MLPALDTLFELSVQGGSHHIQNHIADIPLSWSFFHSLVSTSSWSTLSLV